MNRRERKIERRANKANEATWLNGVETIDDVLRGADNAETIEWIKGKLGIDCNIVVIVENEDSIVYNYNCANERANWLVDIFKRELFGE